MDATNEVLDPPAKGLNDRQLRLIDALVAGQTISAAAKNAKVGRRTVHDWLDTAEFRAELEARRQEVRARVADDVAEVGRLAVGVLKQFLADEQARVSPFRVNVAMDLVKAMGLACDPTAVRGAKSKSS